jgi:hypothetical protein
MKGQTLGRHAITSRVLPLRRRNPRAPAPGHRRLRLHQHLTSAGRVESRRSDDRNQHDPRPCQQRLSGGRVHDQPRRHPTGACRVAHRGPRRPGLAATATTLRDPVSAVPVRAGGRGSQESPPNSAHMRLSGRARSRASRGRRDEPSQRNCHCPNPTSPSRRRTGSVVVPETPHSCHRSGLISCHTTASSTPTRTQVGRELVSGSIERLRKRRS